MPNSCIVCKAVASPVVQLQYCAACQSALYCSETCQRKDWRKQHKPICKLLNVGHGDMQVRSDVHTSRAIDLKERSEIRARDLDKEDKRFFKLFEESTFEGSRAAARKMRKIAKQQTICSQMFLLLHGLRLLARSNSEMLSWPNSPLLVLLHFVDPSMLSGREDEPLQDGEMRFTPLHMLADMADTSDYSTHENQLILAKQLIEHGANVNAEARPSATTPLHLACSGDNVTNLDFIEILLKAGADPNSQNDMESTPLMQSAKLAPGAAKFLLNWPTTDVNISTRSGIFFLDMVRFTIMDFSSKIGQPDNSNQVQDQFLLRQWREIEEMLVKKSAHDTGIAR
jgi:hypothetical protein